MHLKHSLAFVACFLASGSVLAGDPHGQKVTQVPGLPASVLPNLNRLTDAEKAAGWKLLFDGKTTTGWRNFRKPDISAGWQVIDGSLCRVDKTAGDIITTGQYDNFVLELDYKVPPHANSGIMYRVSEDQARRAVHRCRVPDSRQHRSPGRPAKVGLGLRPVPAAAWTPRPASRWTPPSRSASGTTSSWSATARTSSTG